MSNPKDNGGLGLCYFAAFVSLVALAIVAFRPDAKPQPACLCEPVKPCACSDKTSCECDLSQFVTKAELVVVRNGLQERIEANEARCACPKCCTAPAGPVDELEPTPSKQAPEVLPTPKPVPQSRVIKRRCRMGCCR